MIIHHYSLIKNEQEQHQDQNNIFQKLNSTVDFNDLNSPNRALPEYEHGSSKAVAYKWLFSSDMQDGMKIILPSDQPDKSMIFSKDGVLGVSRADNTFVAASEILQQPNFLRRDGLLMKSMDNSKMSFSELSESIDLEAEGEEVINEADDYERVRARNIPWLQSICNKLRMKPEKESYLTKQSMSMLSSAKGSTRASRIVSRNADSNWKDSSSVNGSMVVPKPPAANLRKATIYIDSDNNIVRKENPLSASSSRYIHQDEYMSKPSNVIDVVFEDKTYNRQMVFDDETSFLNQTNYSEFKNRRKIRGIKKRFISPDQVSRRQIRLNLQRTNFTFKSRLKNITPRYLLENKKYARKINYNVGYLRQVKRPWKSSKKFLIHIRFS